MNPRSRFVVKRLRGPFTAPKRAHGGLQRVKDVDVLAAKVSPELVAGITVAIGMTPTVDKAPGDNDNERKNGRGKHSYSRLDHREGVIVLVTKVIPEPTFSYLIATVVAKTISDKENHKNQT